jgi:hypothetical protein
LLNIKAGDDPRRLKGFAIYGKIFDSMYDGTLYGQWEAIVTFQQMIVLADADGIVDMTPQAIAARTSIPFEIIKKGLGILEAADPYSRTPGQDGRRIELIDAHRPWGWHIVNHEKYKRMQDSDMVRAQTRERVRRHRAAIAEGNGVKRDVTDGNAEKRHTDTDTNTKTLLPPSGAFLRFWTAWPKNDRKQSRGKCWELWMRKDFDQQAATILEHVEGLKVSKDWKREAGRFIPAPLVYLNQRRWEGADAPTAHQEKWTP